MRPVARVLLSALAAAVVVVPLAARAQGFSNDDVLHGSPTPDDGVPADATLYGSPPPGYSGYAPQPGYSGYAPPPGYSGYAPPPPGYPPPGYPPPAYSGGYPGYGGPPPGYDPRYGDQRRPNQDRQRDGYNRGTAPSQDQRNRSVTTQQPPVNQGRITRQQNDSGPAQADRQMNDQTAQQRR